MPICLVVDAYSAGSDVAKNLIKLGFKCVHVQITKNSILDETSNFDKKDYIENLLYNGDVIDIVEKIKNVSEEEITCVIHCSESGAELATIISESLNLKVSTLAESFLKNVENNKDSIAERWEKEYTIKGIPSSFREEESSVVGKFFFPYYLNKTPLILKEENKKQVVDIGCGKGRNSFFFEKKGFCVTGFDIVSKNISEIQEYANKNNLNVKAICGDITEKLPIEDNSIDIVIDIFCYKHQLDDKKREFYRSEIFRILKNSGYYLLSLAGKDDGYYGQFLNGNDNKIIDPRINVGSVLFDPEDIKKEFSGYKIKQMQTIRKNGLMHENEYERVTHAFIMKKDIPENDSDSDDDTKLNISNSF